jgi:hypothetical protein
MVSTIGVATGIKRREVSVPAAKVFVFAPPMGTGVKVLPGLVFVVMTRCGGIVVGRIAPGVQTVVYSTFVLVTTKLVVRDVGQLINGSAHPQRLTVFV